MGRTFDRFTALVSVWLGRPVAFLLALSIVLAWAISGPFLAFSDTWQMLINTGTTVVTFLMIFLLQATQSRDNAAVQLKLDALIQVSEVNNSLIAAEERTAEEIKVEAQLLREEARKGNAR